MKQIKNKLASTKYIASPTLHKHHKIAYLYLKHIQFIDLMLGHKKIKLLLFTYIPSINSIKITCF